MNVDIRISAQYYENYSDTSELPYWKAKGGYEFIVRNIDSDLLYFTDEVGEVLKQMVADKSNSHEKFELVSWEAIYTQPEELSKDEMEYKLNNVFSS
jgi:hypothetical protein